MKVFVYFNLHRKCYSIKALEGELKGRVVAHKKDLVLTNAIGKVSLKGRLRVLREGQKNVHAGLVGFISDELLNQDLEGRQITYNPYKVDHFIYKDNQEPFTGGDVVLTVLDEKPLIYH